MRSTTSLIAVCLLVACDGVSSTPNEPDASGSPDSGGTVVAGNKRVFVTDTVYVGQLLGGLAGADMKCEARAAAAGLAGTYKAWLSDDTVSAGSRLTQSTGAYLLVDGSMVAANWQQLTSGTLQRPINVDPFGAAYTAPIKCAVVGGLMAVWTSTNFDGELAQNGPGGLATCTKWMPPQDGNIYNGLVGNAQASTLKWTFSNCGLSCTDEAALYCIEQ